MAYLHILASKTTRLWDFEVLGIRHPCNLAFRCLKVHSIITIWGVFADWGVVPYLGI